MLSEFPSSHERFNRPCLCAQMATTGTYFMCTIAHMVLKVLAPKILGPIYFFFSVIRYDIRENGATGREN